MPTPEFQSGDNQTQETQELSEFGSQFLADNVPEEHRAIVEQYIKPWDGNVTKKFQDLQGKIKEYETLGDTSTLANASQVIADMKEDPVGFFNYYKDYLLENAETIQEVYGIEDINEALGIAMENLNDQIQDDGDKGGLPEFEGVPQEFVSKFQQMEERLSSIDEKTSGIEKGLTEAEQMKILDNALETLHTEHGDFDEDYVLTKIASGKTPEEAVKAYQALTQSAIDSRSKAPKLLSGPSATPLDQVDKTKLRDPKYRKALGAEYLTKTLSN